MGVSWTYLDRLLHVAPPVSVDIEDKEESEEGEDGWLEADWRFDWQLSSVSCTLLYVACCCCC